MGTSSFAISDNQSDLKKYHYILLLLVNKLNGLNLQLFTITHDTLSRSNHMHFVTYIIDTWPQRFRNLRLFFPDICCFLRYTMT